MFLVFVLMFIGLIIIFLEIRKLKKIIRSDIRRFEDDLARFEGAKGKKLANEVMGYVQNSMSRGISERQIRKSLMTKGWGRDQIDVIFRGVKRNQ